MHDVNSYNNYFIQCTTLTFDGDRVVDEFTMIVGSPVLVQFMGAMCQYQLQAMTITTERGGTPC